MKQTHFLLLTVFFIQPTFANNLFSYVNPVTWLRGIQKIYYRKQLEDANKRLFNLSAQRLELENYEHMYSLLNASLEKIDKTSKSDEDVRARQNLMTPINQLNLAFYKKYQEANNYNYHISEVQNYMNEKFTPLLNQTAKECYTTVQQLPKFWYEQLKEKEAKLPAHEKQKTSVERQTEFKDWQVEHSWYKKLKEQESNLPAEVKVKTAAQRREEFKDWQMGYNQKNDNGIERKAFFRNWRINNPNYYQTDFNKI